MGKINWMVIFHKTSTKVPQSIFKKRAREANWASSKAAGIVLAKKDMRRKREEIFKRAEAYALEYKEQEASQIWLKRNSKKTGGFFVPAEAKLAFVLRIKGINNLDPKTRKILQLLRLRQIHNGVFVMLNKNTINMLRRVEQCIAYGYPNLKTVKELVYKRGFGKVDGKRIALTDNSIISNVLGDRNIICIEDLVHEIFRVGPYFKEANNFLWPFKLSSPLGGFKKKRRHYIEGGDTGNREEKINKLVQAMI